MKRREFLAALAGTAAAVTTGWLGGLTDLCAYNAKRGLRDLPIKPLEVSESLRRDMELLAEVQRELERSLFFGNPIIEDMTFTEVDNRLGRSVLPTGTWRKLNA